MESLRVFLSIMVMKLRLSRERIPSLPKTTRQGLSGDLQYERLEQFLTDLCKRSHDAVQ